MPCTPEELDELSNLISRGQHEGAVVRELPLEEQFNTPRIDPASVATHRTLGGFLPHLRSGRGGMGETLVAEVMDPLFIGVNKANKFVADMHEEYNKIVKAVGDQGLGAKFTRRMTGISKELDENLKTLLLSSDEKGNIPKEINSTGRFTEQELDAVKGIRGVMNKVETRTGVGLDEFLHWRDNPPDTATIKQMSTTQKAMVEHITHRAPFRDPDQRVGGLISEYLNAATAAGIKKPLLTELRGKLQTRFLSDDGVNIKGLIAKSGPEMKLWAGIEADVMGRPTALDVKFMQSIDDLYRYFRPEGKPPGLAGLYKASTIFTDIGYMGAMGSPIGGRPSSIIRQFGQLIPSWAEHGTKVTRQAMADVINDIKGPRVMREQYANRGLLSPQLERLDQSVEAGGKLGKTIASTAEVMLKHVGTADSFVRLVTARSAEIRFEEYLAKYGSTEMGALAKLPGKPELREEIGKLLRNGQVEKARDQYIANAVATVQYDYGRGNKPEWSRGAIGRLAGMFTSYPLNTAEMVIGFTKRAVAGGKAGDWAEMAPLARLMIMSSAVMWLGSEFLDADLSSALVFGSMPHTTFYPKMGLDTWTAGRSTVEWGIGNIFDTGETQYAKQTREHAYKSLLNYTSSMIPGYNFATDSMKAWDEGSLARMFALTPKGPELDRLARQKQRDSRVQ